MTPIRVIIAESSDLYADIETNILNKVGIETFVCFDKDTLHSELAKSEQDSQYSIILLDTDFENNGFGELEWLTANYPKVTPILLTENDLEVYMNEIVTHEVCNILCKPVRSDELTGLIKRLTTGEDIFGLNNYLDDVKEMRSVTISKSNEIRGVINEIISTLISWGYGVENKNEIHLILQETIINAVYHSHGYTEAKLEREMIELVEGKFVRIDYGYGHNKAGVAITDFNGTLTKQRILESFYHVFLRGRILLEAAETGADVTGLIDETGRGLDLCRRLASDYYINIKKNQKTEIIFILEKFFYKDDANGAIKIFEID